MSTVIPPLPTEAIVDKDGRMELEMRSWTQDISSLTITTGSGSPEGVVAADATKLYMDTSGSSGSILYIKRDTDIGGDTSKGWILV